MPNGQVIEEKGLYFNLEIAIQAQQERISKNEIRSALVLSIAPESNYLVQKEGVTKLPSRFCQFAK